MNLQVIVIAICASCLVFSGLLQEHRGVSILTTGLKRTAEQSFETHAIAVDTHDPVHVTQGNSENGEDVDDSSQPETKRVPTVPTTTTTRTTVDPMRSLRGETKLVEDSLSAPESSSSSGQPQSEALEPGKEMSKPQGTDTTPSDEKKTSLPSIVVQLQGRLGNYLGKLSQGYGLKLWLEQEYGIETKVVLRHQERPFWVKGRDDLVKCFPKAKDWDFEAANTNDFVELKSEQEEWLGFAMNPYTGNETEIKQYLQNFTHFLSHEKARPATSETDIGLPFLFSDKISDLDIMVDRYYDHIQELFAFDDSCCKNKPDPDESVFVYRNFMAELPRVGMAYGFEELNPNRTAYELFGNLKDGDKIAILTTDRNSTGVHEYVDAFRERGLQARIVEPQEGIEDFCFLKSAKKELVGPARSTFVLWAGLLTECDSVRPYSVNSEATRKWHQGRTPLEHYNFTHPQLAKRMKFELYDA